jgi:4-hydroxybenzoate polyprenyltransferase/phosphoserine phosphatase
MSAARPVLCVDLDGTLVRTDTLEESLIALLRRRPWMLLALPWWLLHGRAHFKAKVAAFDFDPSLLPYNDDLVAFIRAERAAGRSVVLATASHAISARRIAAHLGLFDAVHATEGSVNCKGAAKAEVLAAAYGERGFAYAGDSRADLAVFRRAHSAILVEVPRRVRSALADVPIEREFGNGTSRAAALWKLMRPHQWAKNLLVAVPLLTAHHYGDAHAVAATIIAFVAMCIVASAIYVVNDLLDVHADRRHPTKRLRPLAAGTLPLGWAVATLPLLAVAAVVASMQLTPAFGVALAGYAVAAIAYSLAVKHVAWLDALWLAGLYTLRIYLGALAISVPVSGWLVAFSLFAFASLALLKRFTEIQSLAGRPGVTRARGYRVKDGRRIEVVGWACALVAAGVLVFYFRSATVQTLYRDPHLLWGVAPLLLYLLLEVWWAARAGRMHEDPVWYAIRRPVTYVVLGAVLVLMLLAR